MEALLYRYCTRSKSLCGALFCTHNAVCPFFIPYLDKMSTIQPFLWRSLSRASCFSLGFFPILSTSRLQQCSWWTVSATQVSSNVITVVLYIVNMRLLLRLQVTKKKHFTVPLLCSSYDKMVPPIYTTHAIDLIQYYIGLRCRRLIWPRTRDIFHLIFLSLAFCIQHIYHTFISPKHN